MYKKWFLLLALIFSLIFDKKIMFFFVSLRNFLLNKFMIFFIDYAIIFIVLACLALFLWKKGWLLVFLASFFTTIIPVTILKILIFRDRPFLALGLPKLQGVDYAFQILNSSMPSLHAAAVFSVLPVISRLFPKFKKIWLIFAILVCFSRVYTGVHYLSDAIAGGLLGYFIGYSLLWFEEKRRKFIKRLK